MESASSTRLLTGLLDLFVPPKQQKMVGSQQAGDQKAVSQELQLKILVTELALDALTRFERGELRAFDALVGETSCQLRAVKVARLYSSLVTEPAARERLAETIARLRTLRSCLETPMQPATQSQTTAPPRVVKGQKEDLSHDEYFLVLARTLCLTVDETIPTRTDESNLRKFYQQLDIHPKDLAAIVHRAKDNLAKRSITFLRAEVEGLKGRLKEQPLLKAMVNDVNVTNPNRPCSPCFYNLSTLMERLRREQRPIMLKVFRPGTDGRARCNRLLFQGSEETPFKRLSIIPRSLWNQCVVVIEGRSSNTATRKEFLRTIDGYDLETIILANAAAHPQYAGDFRHAPIPLFVKACQMQDGRTLSIASILSNVQQRVLSGASVDDAYGQVVKLRKVVKDLCQPADPLIVCSAYIRQNQLQARAKAEGFCRENQSTFRVTHILASKIHPELITGATAQSLADDDPEDGPDTDEKELQP